MFTERQRLDALYKISKTLREQDANIQNILQSALTVTTTSVGAKHACLITFHKDDRVNNKLILGPQGDLEGRYALWQELIARGLIGMVHHSRRVMVIHDISTDQRWPQLGSTPQELQKGSAIGLPLEKNGNMYGVMALIHPQSDYFDSEMIDWLTAVANLLSAAVGNAVMMNAIPKDETRYKWLFEDAVVPMIITNLDGYIVDVNRKACDFLRYNRADLIQQAITKIHRLGTGPVGSDRFGSLQEGKEILFRTSVTPKKGEDIPVAVRARRIYLGDNDVILWVEEDMSAQLELEQLRQDLTSMVYHDLRGPLHTIYSSILTLTKLLAREQNSVVKDLLDVGVRSTKQLTRLVESLLDIQRLEEGKAVLDAKPISVSALLAEAAQLVTPLIHESEQKLKLDISDDLPLFTCDADMILRVITNLMENAVKYTPMGGSITLKAHLSAEGVRVCIQDSGPGIAANMQGKIFEKFSRVKYKDAPKGVGLGLAFCRLAVEAHGGRIWVESEPGQGSAFIFILPKSKQTAPLTVQN